MQPIHTQNSYPDALAVPCRCVGSLQQHRTGAGLLQALTITIAISIAALQCQVPCDAGVLAGMHGLDMLNLVVSDVGKNIIEGVAGGSARLLMPAACLELVELQHRNEVRKQ